VAQTQSSSGGVLEQLAALVAAKSSLEQQLSAVEAERDNLSVRCGCLVPIDGQIADFCLLAPVQSHVHSLTAERAVFQQAEEWQLRQELEDAYNEAARLRDQLAVLQQAHQQLQIVLQTTQQQSQTFGDDLHAAQTRLATVEAELQSEKEQRVAATERADALARDLLSVQHQVISLSSRPNEPAVCFVIVLRFPFVSHVVDDDDVDGNGCRDTCSQRSSTDHSCIREPSVSARVHCA
jgi:septal ring factor EnvC (AmiA/AmiB activator)